MPSTRMRLVGEAALLVLVALGLGLAGFSAIVIAVVMLSALVLVALLERASAKEAARAAARHERAEAPPLPAVERAEPEPALARDEKPEPEPEPDPEPIISERSARALLASAAPPSVPERPKARLPRGRKAAPTPPPPPLPAPEPELASALAQPLREWNLWELQRAVRDAPDDERHEEWTALLIHLREFANADGDLPLEFDRLVRESFAPLLARSAEPAATP